MSKAIGFCEFATNELLNASSCKVLKPELRIVTKFPQKNIKRSRRHNDLDVALGEKAFDEICEITILVNAFIETVNEKAESPRQGRLCYLKEGGCNGAQRPAMRWIFGFFLGLQIIRLDRVNLTPRTYDTSLSIVDINTEQLIG